MKYYLHDTNARNDEKCTLIFIKFGYEGLGLFNCILEVLGSQEKPVAESVLKSQLNIGKRLEKQLNFMYKIGILSVKNGDVFNENLLNFSEKYRIKKEKTREKVSEWRKNQTDKKSVTSYKSIRNSPKVKLSKVKLSNKDNIQKNLIKKELEFQKEAITFSDKYPTEMIEDFIRYWCEKNEKKTKMLWQSKPTFEISRRLVTWNKNNQKNNYGQPNKRNHQTGGVATYEEHKKEKFSDFQRT